MTTMSKRFSLWLTIGVRQVQVGSYDTAAEAEAVQARMIEAGAVGVTVVDAGAPDADALAGQVGLPWVGMRQPPTPDAQIEAQRRARAIELMEAAALLYPVVGALRVWAVSLDVRLGRYGAREPLCTCATMEAAEEVAAGHLAAAPAGERRYVVIVDGREVSRAS